MGRESGLNNKTSRRRIVAAHHVFLILALLGPSIFPVTGPISTAHAQLEDLVSRIKPAVVLVEVRHVLGWKGHGSGFIVSPSGYILTNHHVIEGATDISVVLPDKQSFPATVVDYLKRVTREGRELRSVTDVAVLKINAVNLPTLLIRGGVDIPTQGGELLVFGYPGGVGTDQVSITRGIVSAVRSGWLQTDAAIEPGNSGGPVVDRNGHVIGLATLVTGRNRRITGVITLDDIRDFIETALSRNGKRHKEVSIPGMEYMSPILCPKRTTWRVTYDPGTVSAQRYIRDHSVDITEVQDVNGALIYTTHDSRGLDAKSIVDSSGLYLINQWEEKWTYSFPNPITVLPLPFGPGAAWDAGTLVGESPSQGMRLESTRDARLSEIGDVVTVPAGTFSDTIQIVVLEERSIRQGPQTKVYHLTSTSWRAPRIGVVRSITDTSETKEHLVSELLACL